MLDSLPYEQVSGAHKAGDVRVFAISTCAFCKKAIDYLSSNNVEFRFIHLDTAVDLETKRTVKTIIRQKTDQVPVWPLLMVDDKVVQTGFLEEQWAGALGLS